MVHDQTMAAQSLLMAVIVQQMIDLDDAQEGGLAGYDWLCGPIAAGYMHMLGLSEEAIFGLRMRVLLGDVDRRALDSRRLNAFRFGNHNTRATAADEAWQGQPVGGFAPLR